MKRPKPRKVKCPNCNKRIKHGKTGSLLFDNYEDQNIILLKCARCGYEETNTEHLPEEKALTRFTVPCDMYDGCGGCNRKTINNGLNELCLGESLRTLTIPEIKRLADDWKPSNDCHHYLFKSKEESS